MTKAELELINRYLGSEYDCEDVYFDGDALVERAAMKRLELPHGIFAELLKAKRLEHLRRIALPRLEICERNGL